VQQDQQGHFLKIIDQDNVVQRRNVQVGVRDGTDWAIAPGSSELAEGDRVIAEGGSAYKEGTTVEIVTQP
jgi:membrane fusion protein (multidrug efflux system)